MFVTAALCYLFAGSVIWAFLFGSDVWERTVERRPATPLGVVIGASAMLIAFWPLAVWAFVRGGKMVSQAKRRAF